MGTMKALGVAALLGCCISLAGCGNTQPGRTTGGAAAGAATGGTIGIVGGPIGVAVGALIGGGVGAVTGANTTPKEVNLPNPPWSESTGAPEAPPASAPIAQPPPPTGVQPTGAPSAQPSNAPVTTEPLAAPQALHPAP